MYLGEQKPRYTTIGEHTRDADNRNGGPYFGRVTRVFLLGLAPHYYEAPKFKSSLPHPESDFATRIWALPYE